MNKKIKINRLFTPALIFALLLGWAGIQIALAASGGLDATFDSDGKANTNINVADIGKSMALQSDGKIMVVGYTFIGGANYDFAAARLCPTGAIDNATNCGGTGFDTDGKLTTDFFSNDDRANDVAVQSDGKIVVVGQAKNGTNTDFAVVRYNSDGSLDTGFDTDGKVTTDFSGNVDQAYSVALQSDGKIVVAGASFLGGGSYNFALARYNSDGSLDTSFDADGKVTTDIAGGNDYAYSVLVQSDGKIVAAGAGANGANDNFALVRYCTNGALDNGTNCGTGFGTGGVAATDFNFGIDIAYGVALQSDGKILAAGRATVGGIPAFGLARYCTDGALDNGTNCGAVFGTLGKVTTTFAGVNDIAYDVVQQSDGKIVLAGYARYGTNNNFALARYCPNGAVDNGTNCGVGFGSGGLVSTDFNGAADQAYSVALQSDDKILAAGQVNYGNDDFGVARYKTVEEQCSLAAGGTYTFYNNNMPVTIYINPGSLGDLACITVQRFNYNHPNATIYQQTGYYWAINGVNASGAPASGFNVNLTLPYSAADANDKLCRYDTTYSQWYCNASSFVANTSVTLNGVTAFSGWAAGNNSPTAVTLAGFDALPAPGGVLLRWQTLTESSVLGFKLYRSTDALADPELLPPLTANLLPPKNLGSPFGAEYTFLDNTAQPGIVYHYWLKAVYLHGAEWFGPASGMGIDWLDLFIPFLRR